MYLSNNISTENDDNMHVGKVWTTIDRISTIWKSELWFNKMRILQSCSHISTAVWLHHWDFNEMLGEKAIWELYKDAALNKSLKHHLTKHQLYSHLSPITQILQERWARHAGVLWNTTHGHTSVDWLAKIQIY